MDIDKDKTAEQLRACREKWEYAFKKYAQENELKLREYHSHLFGWMAACDWMNNRADSGEAVAWLTMAYRAGFIKACNWPAPVSQDVDSQAFAKDLRIFLEAHTSLLSHPRATSEDVRDAERYRAMRSAVYRHNVEIGEATLLLRVIGVCPTEEEFDQGIDAIDSREGK